MKKLITILLLGATLLTTASACNRERTIQREIESLVSSYKSCDGFETVNIGSFLLGIAKTTINIAAEDEEERLAANLMKELNKISIIEYSDCNGQVASEFSSKFKQIIANSELLISVNDDGDSINIYSHPSEDGKTLKDILIWNDSDKCIVCFFGTIDIEKFADLVSIYS